MILTSELSYRLHWIIQKSLKCLFEWSKQPKMRFSAIFLSFIHQIDLKLHIFILLNDLCSWAVISPVLDHSKIINLLFVCCLFVVCLLCVCCLFVVCFLSFCCLFVVCLLFVCRLFVVCFLFVCWFFVVRLLFVCCFFVYWRWAYGP